MFVGTNRIRVKTGAGQELERRFQERGGIERQPGFLEFEMWRLEGDEDYEEYLIVTHWESRDAQKAWVRSDAFKQAHSGPGQTTFLDMPDSEAMMLDYPQSPDGKRMLRDA